MANVHGKDSYVELANKADVLTNFTGQITNLSWNPSKKIVDATAMGAVAEENIDGQRDASSSLSGFCDSATTALIRALYASLGASKSFKYGPEGSTTPAPRITGTHICTSLGIKAGVDAVVGVSASFAINGTWTEDTF